MIFQITSTLALLAILSPLNTVWSLQQQQPPQPRRGFLQNTLGSSFLVILAPDAARAYNEIGVEREADTFLTGETVEICTKRGPLGACLKTERRTEENDNDKAKKYFKDPAELTRRRNEVLTGATADGESNPLIEKLQRQTAENKEKNDLDVQVKTFMNDQGANFGPFNRQVVILNTDGRTFTLLENPQAMRLKKAGFIEGRKFVKQPTDEEIEQALTPEGPGLAESILGALGGSGGSS